MFTLAGTLVGCGWAHGYEMPEGDVASGPTDADGGMSRMPEADGAIDEEALYDGPRSAYCMGAGPPVVVGEPSTPSETRDRCTGAIAERLFGYALCSCSDVDLAGFLTTRSFSSRLGDDPTASGGPVGVNRRYISGSYTDVGGTFTVAEPGVDGLELAGYLQVGGDTSIASDVRAAGFVDIDRDARVGGDIVLPGVLSVGRDLHQPPGAMLSTVPFVGGRRVSGPVDVAPPCACGSDEILDVAAIVRRGVTDNDNAEVGLDPDALRNLVGLVETELPCGRFYVRGIGGTGGLRLRVTGRTALFVDGDIDTIGAFDVDLAPGAELDVFINGNLIQIGAGSFGDVDRPAASRIYIGGEGEVQLTGADEFVGNVYAPRSRVTAIGAVFMHGSLFAGEVVIPGALMVTYDRAILRAGDDCPAPPGGCSECDGMCDGTCRGGACVPCETDADCCGALVCLPSGECGPYLI